MSSDSARRTAELYRSMADREVHGISPIYESLCRAVAADPAVCQLISDLPVAKRQPNLLLAVVRLLDGPIESPKQFLAFVTENWAEASALVLTHSTQTNEPGRCAVLLPVLSAFASPLALIEVGASAGLCLFPDRYRYRYRTRAEAEHCVGAGPVELVCDVDGPVPLPDRLPDIRWRAGLDLNPLDAASDTDCDWLRALVWPEQTGPPGPFVERVEHHRRRAAADRHRTCDRWARQPGRSRTDRLHRRSFPLCGLGLPRCRRTQPIHRHDAGIAPQCCGGMDLERGCRRRPRN